MQQRLSGYAHSMKTFNPNSGELDRLNADRRYIGERLEDFSDAERRTLASADARIDEAVKAARGSFQEPFVADLAEYLSSR